MLLSAVRAIPTISRPKAFISSVRNTPSSVKVPSFTSTYYNNRRASSSSSNPLLTSVETTKATSFYERCFTIYPIPQIKRTVELRENAIKELKDLTPSNTLNTLTSSTKDVANGMRIEYLKLLDDYYDYHSSLTNISCMLSFAGIFACLFAIGVGEPTYTIGLESFLIGSTIWHAKRTLTVMRHVDTLIATEEEKKVWENKIKYA